jgi:CHAT domain-containing protein
MSTSAAPLSPPEDQPIERIAALVASGEIDLSHGKALVVEPGVSSRLTLRYTQSVAQLVQHFVSDHDARPALLVADLLHTAVGALPEDQTHAPIRTVGDLAWIRAITATLPDSPDWPLYRSARRVAASLLSRSRSQHDAQVARWTHSELGDLHFQVLASLTVAASVPEGRWAIWYQEGDARASGTAPYPKPSVAFGRAYRHFVHAALGADEPEQTAALRGQIEALDWQGRTTGAPQLGLMADIADEALAHTDAAADLVSATYLLGIRQQAGRPTDAAVFQQALSVSVEEQIKRFGPASTVNAHLNLAKLIESIDPRLALALLERAAPAVVQAHDPTILERHCNALIITLIQTMFRGSVDNSAGTRAATVALRGRAEAENWTVPEIAGALLALARDSISRSEEGDGLVLLDAAEQIFPDPFSAYPAAMQFWRVTLWSREAGNRSDKGEFEEAIKAHVYAISLALPLGLSQFASKQLEYLVSDGVRGGDPVLLTLLGALFEIGLDLEIGLGASAVERLQQVASLLTERQVASGTAHPNLLHFTWQISKARRFSAAIRTDAVRKLTADPILDDLTQRIAPLRGSVALGDEGAAPGAQLDRTHLLLSFVRDQIPTSGATPSEQLINLQARFDQRLELMLAAHSRVRESEVYSLEQLRPSLGDRTAILQLYLGEFGGQRAIYAMLAAKQGEWFSITRDQATVFATIAEHGRTELAYSYEEDVFLVRQALLDETRDEQAVAPYLHAAGGAFLHGPLAEALDRLSAEGCDHLVIVPHGPYHFAPLQLFARKSRLLVDDWNVTVLPTIELARGRSSAAEHRDGLASFGVSFTTTNPYGLPTLPEAAEEAEQIAAALGTTALVDDQVTERAILDVLPRVRYLHLATHGAMNLDAPSFQYVVVTPNGSDDGLLHAHELLRQDLRGIRLVTLSACETALGRVDRADNPRGLPAALLLAGAETIVGTLWEIASDTAQAFFVELYRALAGKQNRLEAFRHAQTEIRRQFPHPRDWGAFFFMGAWRD